MSEDILDRLNKYKPKVMFTKTLRDDCAKEIIELRTKLAQVEVALKAKDDALYDAIEMVGHVDNIRRLHAALAI